jgi:hypothetical protein
MTTPSSSKRSRVTNVIRSHGKYLDGIERTEGLAHARAAALDLIGANAYWLIEERRIQPRQLYDYLQNIADAAIEPDLVK